MLQPAAVDTAAGFAVCRCNTGKRVAMQEKACNAGKRVYIVNKINEKEDMNT